MTLASSGTLSINDIAGEFGGSANPESLSEFYRGGSRVPNTSGTSSIPTSGTIAISNFYGTSNVQPDIISGTVANVAYGSGKTLLIMAGIRPSTTVWQYNAVTQAFSQTTTSEPTGGSWSDNLAEGSNVTINAFYTYGTSFIPRTRISSNNLSALHGKTRSQTQILFNGNTNTTTNTQNDFHSYFPSASPSNQYIVDGTSLANIQAGSTLTVSWT